MSELLLRTQPMPNPLSWYFHWAPQWVNKGGVLFNHFSELLIPFAYFLPQPISGIAGLITIVFQLSIIISGNLSWLELVDSGPGIFHTGRQISFSFGFICDARNASTPRATEWVNYGIGGMVVVLSVPVVLNMVSARQIMNLNFNPLHLVGTYGAFGSITRPRYEVIVEGTDDSVVTIATRWRAYEFKGKPGDTARVPPQIAPYHLRLDWLMWFAAMSSYQDYPWFVNFVAKLLEGDAGTLSLLRTNPFPDKPPRYVRAVLYEYHFTTPQERKQTGAWWKRTLTGAYFPAVSLETPGFRRVLKDEGWLP